MISLRLPRRSPRPASVLLILLLGGCTAGDASPPDTARARATARGGSPPGAEPRVQGVRGSYDLGDYFVLGEVVNPGEEPLYGVELALEYRDAAGRVLGTDEAAPILAAVEPGGTAPFTDIRYAAPEGIATVTARVTRWSTESLVPYHPLTILDARARNGISGVVVEGRLRNDSGRPLTAVKLAASFRNAGGEVTGLFFDYPVLGALPAGEEVDFTIETIDSTIEGHEVKVQGEGQADARAP